MIRLLGACIGVLQEQGMRKLFIDAVKGGDDGFQAIGTSGVRVTVVCVWSDLLTRIAGFKKWARYRDVWREL